VALTLSDPFWVQLQRDAFVTLLPRVDILLGNEAEALEMTGEADLEAALAALAKGGGVVALTRGAAGAIASDGKETVSVAAQPVTQVQDTTGAGDLFAAGFLLGLARGRALDDCLRLGALAAAEVISHIGARPQAPPDGGWRSDGLEEAGRRSGRDHPAVPAARHHQPAGERDAGGGVPGRHPG
jgi:sugar/nucleoside kinase (ribokinase family)